MTFEPGMRVERLHVTGPARFGTLLHPVREGFPNWHVRGDDGLGYLDVERNLRVGNR